MAAKTLRDYQIEALHNQDRDFAAGLNRLVVLLFTGAGKTFVMAHTGLRHHLRFDGRILVLTHREELMEQIVGAFKEVAPHLNVGRVKAKKHNDVTADVVVASVQTLLDPGRREQIKDVTLVLADECHHGVSASWMTVLRHFGAFNGVRTVGFTATLTRHDELGLGDLWQKVTIKRTIEWGVKHGYIVPDVTTDFVVPDLTLVETPPDVDGDWNTEALGKALANPAVLADIAAEHKREMGDRRTIVFAPNKAVAAMLAVAFAAAGITCDVVLGDTKSKDRQTIYDAHKADEFQSLINVGVCTEGYDDPGISGVMILNVVRSDGLYIQEVGRGTRKSPGKTDCRVIRAAGTTAVLETKADLRKSAAPHRRTPKPAPKPTAPVAPPTRKRSDHYRATQDGPLVRVWRDGVLIYRKKAASAAEAPRLARILIDLDIAQRARLDK